MCGLRFKIRFSLTRVNPFVKEVFYFFCFLSTNRRLQQSFMSTRNAYCNTFVFAKVCYFIREKLISYSRENADYNITQTFHSSINEE